MLTLPQAQGSAESLVPILYAQLGDAQQAVDEVMQTVRLSINEFDSMAKKLRVRYSHDEKVSKALDQFILGCVFYCTGNLSWR